MTAIPARRLNHAVLYVSDLGRSVEFWTAALDFEVVSEYPGQAAFLRLRHGANHHDLGLFQVGSNGQVAGRPPGLYHLAWQLDTIDELAAARQTLADLGALAGSSSHGATKSLYAKDPDGIEFEIMWMLPRADWGAYDRQATVEALDLDSEVRRWSGVSTAGEFARSID